MALPFDPAVIGRDILSELSIIISGDITQHAAFAERQVRMLSKQGAMIGAAAIAGDITDDEKEFFAEDLKNATENFVRALVALTALTIEKAWNAVVGILWGAINNALQQANIPFKFPIPGIPSA